MTGTEMRTGTEGLPDEAGKGDFDGFQVEFNRCEDFWTRDSATQEEIDQFLCNMIKAFEARFPGSSGCMTFDMMQSVRISPPNDGTDAGASSCVKDMEEWIEDNWCSGAFWPVEEEQEGI